MPEGIRPAPAPRPEWEPLASRDIPHYPDFSSGVGCAVQMKGKHGRVGRCGRGADHELHFDYYDWD